MRVRGAVAQDRNAVGTGGDDLRTSEPLLQTVKALGVNSDIAVDELVLVEVARSLDLHAGLKRTLVVEVATSLDDEAVNVSVATEDDKLLGPLNHGTRGRVVRLVDVTELDLRKRSFLVVRVRVALNRQEGQTVENRGLLNERLKNATLEVVGRKLRGLSQRKRGKRSHGDSGRLGERAAYLVRLYARRMRSSGEEGSDSDVERWPEPTSPHLGDSSFAAR